MKKSNGWFEGGINKFGEKFGNVVEKSVSGIAPQSSRKGTLSLTRFVFMDVETTGLDYRKGHRIIELGAVAMKDGQILSEYQSLIHVNVPIPKHVSKIHGITNEMLSDQPGPETVFPDVKSFIADSILVAHNAKFDIGFLRSEFNRLKLSFNNKIFCTLDMSRRRYPRLPNYKLSTVYKHLVGMVEDMFQKPEASGTWPQIRQHRALDDARMVTAIWMAMEGK